MPNHNKYVINEPIAKYTIISEYENIVYNCEILYRPGVGFELFIFPYFVCIKTYDDVPTYYDVSEELEKWLNETM